MQTFPENNHGFTMVQHIVMYLHVGFETLESKVWEFEKYGYWPQAMSDAERQEAPGATQAVVASGAPCENRALLLSEKTRLLPNPGPRGYPILWMGIAYTVIQWYHLMYIYIYIYICNYICTHIPNIFVLCIRRGGHSWSGRSGTVPTSAAGEPNISKRHQLEDRLGYYHMIYTTNTFI